MFSLSKNFIYQRHYDVDRDLSLFQYVVENMNKRKFDKIYYLASDKNHFYEINLIGSLIIEEISNKKSVEEIADHLSLIYKVPLEVLNNDIITFIDYLQKIGIVVSE